MAGWQAFFCYNFQRRNYKVAGGFGNKIFVGAEKEEQVVERVFDFNTKTVTLNSGYKMPLNCC